MGKEGGWGEEQKTVFMVTDALFFLMRALEPLNKKGPSVNNGLKNAYKNLQKKVVIIII